MTLINKETANSDEFEMANLRENEPMARASFSRLDYYNNCPCAFKYKYIEKIEPLSAPDIVDKDGNVKPPAWKRGSVIHQAMDDYINGRREDLIPELNSLSYEINEARKLKSESPDRVLTEQNKYFNLDYDVINMNELTEEQMSVTSGGDPCPINYHVLVIIDLLIFNEDFTEAKIIDLKSGKQRAVKHGQQTQLYTLFTAIEYPTVQNFISELWYCDQSGKVVQKEYTRQKILALFNYWDRRIMQLLNDENYYTKPSEHTCMFCEYGLQEHSNKWVNKLGRCKDSLDKRYRI